MKSPVEQHKYSHPDYEPNMLFDFTFGVIEPLMEWSKVYQGMRVANTAIYEYTKVKMPDGSIWDLTHQVEGIEKKKVMTPILTKGNVEPSRFEYNYDPSHIDKEGMAKIIDRLKRGYIGYLYS